MFRKCSKIVNNSVDKWFRRSVIAAGVLFACVTSSFADVPCRILLPERLRTTEVIQQAEQVSAILDDLSKNRERFLQTGDLTELFPELYYHSTLAQFENAMSLDPPMAEAMLRFMVIYYDSYTNARQAFDLGGAKAVEPHWRRYYSRAVELNRSKKPSSFEVLAVLLYGIDAHLIDFARSMRHTLSNSGIKADEFRDAHIKTDKAFFSAAKAINKDVSDVRKLDGRIMTWEGRLGLGARYVIKGRNEAWTEAIGNGPLRAAKPMPVLPRKEGSNIYFTLNAAEACQKPLYSK